MLTAENLTLFFAAIAISLSVAIGYDKLHPSKVVTKEERLELEVQQLRLRVEALQEAQESLAAQNQILRNRVQTLESDRQNLEIQLARLRGEMGRPG